MRNVLQSGDWIFKVEEISSYRRQGSLPLSNLSSRFFEVSCTKPKHLIVKFKTGRLFAFQSENRNRKSVNCSYCHNSSKSEEIGQPGLRMLSRSMGFYGAIIGACLSNKSLCSSCVKAWVRIMGLRAPIRRAVLQPPYHDCLSLAFGC